MGFKSDIRRCTFQSHHPRKQNGEIKTQIPRELGNHQNKTQCQNRIGTPAPQYCGAVFYPVRRDRFWGVRYDEIDYRIPRLVSHQV